MRTYDRTWEEIESMLSSAEAAQRMWIDSYFNSKKLQDVEGQKDAARNKKALEGVIKTLQWVLGEEGVENPLHWPDGLSYVWSNSYAM